MVAVTVRDATSITLTVPAPLLATKTRASLAVTPQGATPTGIVATTASVGRSITVTVLSPLLATKTVEPTTTAPAGRTPTGIVARTVVPNESITLTELLPALVTTNERSAPVPWATSVGSVPTANRGASGAGAQDFGWQRVTTLTVPSPEFATRAGTTAATPFGWDPTLTGGQSFAWYVTGSAAARAVSGAAIATSAAATAVTTAARRRVICGPPRVRRLPRTLSAVCSLRRA